MNQKGIYIAITKLAASRKGLLRGLKPCTRAMSLLCVALATMTGVMMTGLMTSCASEEPAVKGPSTTIKGKFNVDIMVRSVSENASRATDPDGSLNHGEYFEHQIGTDGNYAIFFDENKKFYTLTPLELSLDNKVNDPVIEAVYRATIDPDQYAKLPKYCLVVLNAEKFLDIIESYNENTTSDDVINKLIWADSDPLKIGRNDDGFFTMTNSMYYDGNNVKCDLVELKESMIIDPSDPKSVAEAEKLIVYVERMVAKFTLEFDDKEAESNGEYVYYDEKAEHMVVFDGFNEKTGYPQYVTHPYEIVVTGWNINGLEQQSYMFKKINNSNYFNSWIWKSPSEFRTYWAEDSHYDGKYPWQYRKSCDVLNVPYYENYEYNNANQLRNYSYNELKLGGRQFGNVVYVPENTYNYGAIYRDHDGRPDLLAGTHLLIGAELRVGYGTPGNYSFVIEDIYRDREGFYYFSHKDCFKACVFAFNSAMTTQDKMRFTFYNWSGNNASYHGRVLYARPAGEYKIYYNGVELTNSYIDNDMAPDIMAIATIKYGDGRRLPWPKTGTLSLRGTNMSYINIYDENGNYVTTTNDANLGQDLIKSLMYEWVGAIDHFHNGKLYYAAKSVITDTAGEGYAICGTVRNGWYQFNLKGISSIGTPIDNPDQPIVPETISEFDQINVTVNILGWHLEHIYAPILP